MSNRRRTTRGSANFSLGINYMGVGVSLGYSSAPTETDIIQQPQINNQPMGIEGNYPRYGNRSIEASRGNQPLALGAPSSRDHRAYTDEGRSSRDHRAYTDEGQSSRDHRAYTDEGRSSRDHRAYTDEGRSSRGNDSNYRLLAFYRNEIPSEPNGVLIETILQDWSGNYDKLDNMNSYIQWVFPTRTEGRNSRAPLLTDEFVREINSSSILRERAQRAFRMILNFYGMQMEDISTIILTNDSSKRLKIIRSDSKYYLVISRIISFFKEIDMVPLMKVWLKFLATLIALGELDDKAKESYNEYWINILDQSDEKEIRDYIRQLYND